MKLTFRLCLGFILTFVGFHWGAQMIYNLIAHEFLGTRAIIALLLVGGGAGCAIGFGIQMLRNELEPRPVYGQPVIPPAGQPTAANLCECGRPLVVGAKFCAGCGRRLS